jgi:hypothetical protein
MQFLLGNVAACGYLLLLPLTTLILSGCSKKPTSFNAESLFDATRRDLGGIRVNADYSVSFRITNTTDNPVLVSAIKTTCGCVVAEFDHSEIAPGDHRDVTLNLNTDGQTTLGPFVKNATVEFGSGEKVQLQLAARLESDFDVEPRRLQFSADGRTQTMTLTRRQLGTDEFSQMVLVADPERFEAVENQTARTADRREFRVTMKEAPASSALPEIYFAATPGGKPYPFSTVNCHRTGPTLRPSAFVVVLSGNDPKPAPQRFELVSFESQRLKLTAVDGFDEQSRRLLNISFDPVVDEEAFSVSLAESPAAPVTNLFVSVDFKSVDGSATGRLLLPCHIVTATGSQPSSN